MTLKLISLRTVPDKFFSKQCHRALHGSRRSLVAEEVRRVQSRHRRVLGELNLSVEAMLMPTTVDNNEEEMTQEAHGTSTEELLPSVGPADDLLSRVGCDMDSGFSGSSTASYRYVGELYSSVLICADRSQERYVFKRCSVLQEKSVFWSHFN